MCARVCLCVSSRVCERACVCWRNWGWGWCWAGGDNQQFCGGETGFPQKSLQPLVGALRPLHVSTENPTSFALALVYSEQHACRQYLRRADRAHHSGSAQRLGMPHARASAAARRRLAGPGRDRGIMPLGDSASHRRACRRSSRRRCRGRPPDKRRSLSVAVPCRRCTELFRT